MPLDVRHLGARLRLRPRPARRVPERNLPRLLLRRATYLLVVLGLHVAAMVVFEGLTPAQAVWLTLTTVTTVGYGDLSAETWPGRTATIVLIYVGGVYVIVRTVGVYSDYRAERRRLMQTGRWRWNMRDHILVLNVPAENPVEYMRRLAGELGASRRYGMVPIMIVTRFFEGALPEPLHELGIVHYCGDAADPAVLTAAGVREAAVIIVLARDDTDPGSDGRIFDILDRLTELGTKARVLAECVKDADRARLRRVGADIVMRPLRAYPEMIVRALAAPGAEAIMEDLFTSRGDECWRYDVRFCCPRWADVVCVLLEADIGTPIGFRSAGDGQVKVNPPPGMAVEADKLYVLVREGNARPDAQVQALLEGKAGRQAAGKGGGR